MKQKEKFSKAQIIEAGSKLLVHFENIEEYAFIILDIEGRVINWNKGAQKLLGYTEKEILGKNFSIFLLQKIEKQSVQKENLSRQLLRGMVMMKIGWYERMEVNFGQAV